MTIIVIACITSGAVWSIKPVASTRIGALATCCVSHPVVVTETGSVVAQVRVSAIVNATAVATAAIDAHALTVYTCKTVKAIAAVRLAPVASTHTPKSVCGRVKGAFPLTVADKTRILSILAP